MPQVRKGELRALAIASRNAEEDPPAAADTVKALQAADYRSRAEALGVELIGSTPEELARHQRAEIQRWTKIGRAANIKVD
jgi:tripartite-type tricarboxylate transporter receptor subunit TctC